MPAPLGHPPYNKNGEGGQPRKYSKFDIENFADELMEWLKVPTNVWFKDFCLDKDIDPDWMSEWSRENERFGGVYKIAKSRQESRLINGGLTNIYNGGIVKLVLSNAHGWADKQDTKLSGDSANPLACIIMNGDGISKDLISDGE